MTVPVLPTLLFGSNAVAFLSAATGGPCCLWAIEDGGLSVRLRDEKLDRNREARLLKRPLAALPGRVGCIAAGAVAFGEGVCIDIGRMRV